MSRASEASFQARSLPPSYPGPRTQESKVLHGQSISSTRSRAQHRLHLKARSPVLRLAVADQAAARERRNHSSEIFKWVRMPMRKNITSITSRAAFSDAVDGSAILIDLKETHSQIASIPARDGVSPSRAPEATLLLTGAAAIWTFENGHAPTSRMTGARHSGRPKAAASIQILSSSIRAGWTLKALLGQPAEILPSRRSNDARWRGQNNRPSAIRPRLRSACSCGQNLSHAKIRSPSRMSKRSTAPSRAQTSA